MKLLVLFVSSRALASYISFYVSALRDWAYHPDVGTGGYSPGAGLFGGYLGRRSPTLAAHVASSQPHVAAHVAAPRSSGSRREFSHVASSQPHVAAHARSPTPAAPRSQPHHQQEAGESFPISPTLTAPRSQPTSQPHARSPRRSPTSQPTSQPHARSPRRSPTSQPHVAAPHSRPLPQPHAMKLLVLFVSSRALASYISFYVSALRDWAYHPDVGTHACRISPWEVGIPTC
jgi:hypothetical protein